MDMLGHDDVAPQVEVVDFSSPGDGIHQPLTTAIFAKELVSMVAGKSKLVSMAGKVHRPTEMANGSVFQNHERSIVNSNWFVNIIDAFIWNKMKS